MWEIKLRRPFLAFRWWYWFSIAVDRSHCGLSTGGTVWLLFFSPPDDLFIKSVFVHMVFWDNTSDWYHLPGRTRHCILLYLQENKHNFSCGILWAGDHHRLDSKYALNGFICGRPLPHCLPLRVVRVIELLCGEEDEIIQRYRYPEDPPAATDKHCNCYTRGNLLWQVVTAKTSGKHGWLSDIGYNRWFIKTNQLSSYFCFRNLILST